ncbi:MAG: hypothetical protein P1P78_13230 [Methyloprofundus sp.]|nr:hypothetical protein [Methyloprofundus sp.]
MIGDKVSDTQHPKIMRAQEHSIVWAELRSILQKLQQCNNENQCHKVRDILMAHVSGFKPQCAVEDGLG